MPKNLLHRPRLQLILVLGTGLGFFVFLLVAIYFILVKDTAESYSLVQSWKEYYSVEDWNLSQNAVVDIDGDGKKDMITITHCAFLSTVKLEDIAVEDRCEEPTMSVLAFRDNSVSVGQELVSQKPFQYSWLRKSYLVKTNEDVWKFYDMNGLQLRTFELGADHLFEEVNPTFLDKVDVFTYQLSNVGVILLP